MQRTKVQHHLKSSIFGNEERSEAPRNVAAMSAPVLDEGQAAMVEMEHSIGYNSKYADTIQFHPTEKDTLIYNIGGLLVIENLHDKHKQEFLRGHDMELSAIAVSNSGALIATGQKGTVFQRTPDAPVILWSYETRKPLIVLKGVQTCVNRLVFSPDDRFLACVGQNNTLIVWSTQDGKAIYSRITEAPVSMLTWGALRMDVNPKHPTYSLITGSMNQVSINQLEFDISSMQYNMKSTVCQLPNTGLARTYTFARVNGDMILAGTTGGEICVFSMSQAIYRASMPMTSNGLVCGIVDQDNLYVGGGDGKIKKVSLAGGAWTLTHEAQLDSRVMSINLSIDGEELIVGTQGGKMYRVLTNDLSYLLHSDAHIGCINDIAFGQDSNIFVTGDDVGALKVWDLSEYKCLGSYHTARSSGISSLCFASND